MIFLTILGFEQSQNLGFAFLFWIILQFCIKPLQNHDKWPFFCGKNWRQSTVTSLFIPERDTTTGVCLAWCNPPRAFWTDIWIGADRPFPISWWSRRPEVGGFNQGCGAWSPRSQGALGFQLDLSSWEPQGQEPFVWLPMVLWCFMIILYCMLLYFRLYNYMH